MSPDDTSPDSESAPDERSPAEAARRFFNETVRRAVKRAHKRQDKLDAEETESAGAEALLQEAELLKAALPTLKRGVDSVTVPDYFAQTPGAMRTIAIDPTRPPRDHIQRLFKQARKLENCREQAAARAQANRDLTAKLERLRDDFDAWRLAAQPDTEMPPALCARAESLGLECAPRAEAQPVAEAERPLGRREKELARLMQGVRTFASHDGLEILVGKTATDNDTLTFRIARGNDWWFHLGAAPGSHVVVRSPGGGALPQETLLDAAHLCVHFSKMRTAPKADVTYTQARHVRRIKGAPPGKVLVERSESLYLRLEPARLERLLGKHRSDG